jgi:glucose-6-phosphate-specific signal transduction histidine kinase
MILGEVIISVIFFFINASFNQKYTNYGIYRQIKDIWKIVFGGAVAASLALIVIVFIDSLLLWLVAGILITGLTYLLIEYLINRELINSSWSLIMNLRPRKI